MQIGAAFPFFFQRRTALFLLTSSLPHLPLLPLVAATKEASKAVLQPKMETLGLPPLLQAL